MVFPFGVSISDFVTGVKLVKDAIDSLSDTRGARADYAELSRSMGSLERALTAASAAVLDTDARRDALQKTVKDCQDCIASFLNDIAKFNALLNPKASTLGMSARLRKIQWALCKKEDVMKFRSRVEMHVGALDMLLLTFQVESLMRVHTRVENTHGLVVGIENQLKESQTVQDAQNQQLKRIIDLQEDDALRTLARKDNHNVLLDIQQKLTSVVSPEDQQMIVHLLQQTLQKNELLEQQLEELKGQNQILERHILEIKATVQMQRNLPPQVLLQQPVILHDAVGRISPFHLEFINSAKALKAVLKVRFQNVGLRKIIANEYGLRDANKQTDIDLFRSWETVFLPGQHVEMSMWFADDELQQNRCPGCTCYDSRHFEEREGVKCLFCPMTYWRRGAIDFDDSEADGKSKPPSKEALDPISSFCRVDLVETKEPKTESVQGENHPIVHSIQPYEEDVWYCPHCGDGPYSSWNRVCASCSSINF
ncbi:hypothetical protein K458DRAFT_394952 [Lentithecium fluviatile CBS 122367]|uniref:Ubiquitin-like domain-containing protein n=1 Tax=Lentithecium fluviatile CBS 122367 TaxID=1168545 RepID=A0A6G1IK98_9PLEO|nr:hypothetical protein K458DRAFT_394952 [Lentithecium fluviatile CBS 122367]